MLIRCKKTGEEYEITDREIGEKIECPCCGEKFVVDDALLPENVYEAALIRKSEAVVLQGEPMRTLYRHGSEGDYAKLFDSAYEGNDVEAQFQLARWLYDCNQEYSLAAYWFGLAATRKHFEAARRLKECHSYGFGVKQDENRHEIQNHISDLLEWERYQRTKEAAQNLVTWRESIAINCPVCESAIKLPTKLMGDKVRCPSCKGVFLAKGEGIMTTDERNRHRFESRFDEEAKMLKDRFMSCRSAVESILEKLGVDYDKYLHEYFISGIGNGVGYGRHAPWMGVYLSISWVNRGFDIRSYLDEFRNVIESVFGVWVRIISCDTTSSLGEIKFYLRHDRPCEQNLVFKREMERRMLTANSQEKATHPLVTSRQTEAERLDYLLCGDVDDFEASRNGFYFSGYLSNKYPVTGLSVPNLPPGEPWCIDRGLNDGFGIIVRSKTILTNEVLSKVVQDVEKRCSRRLTFVRRCDIDGKFEYSFLTSMPNQGVATQLRLPPHISTQSRVAVGQGASINERSTNMKRATTSVPQHIGKGTRVDWSLENKVFAEMIARYGIKKFHVEMANPYCAEISIPMNVNENTVRKFANDLFHELDVLDADCELDFGQNTDCSVLDLNEDAGCYYVVFNHHDVKDAAPGDAMYKYKVEAISAGSEDDDDDDSDESASGELTPAQVMKYIADGIKSGEIKSKSGEGYFVLKGEFFDEIKAGRKTTEYRDLSPRNLSKSIGIKTIKLQRGYGHPGQPPEQMRFEVASVGLLDADDRECDPYNIPKGFIATTIAIHLGKRIG